MARKPGKKYQAARDLKEIRNLVAIRSPDRNLHTGTLEQGRGLSDLLERLGTGR